jgi:iron complex outermembrane recepter protein
MKTRVRGRSCVPGVGAILLAASVLQTPRARADEPSVDQLQEVTVTARRQEESVLKVPQSVTVMDNAALTRLDIRSFDDLSTQVPNLSTQIGNNSSGAGSSLGYGGARAINIRGVSGGGTTGFYIDDTPVPATIDPQVVDLSRVEVLKGPQGTLYGEGSMGGNVRYVTNQPTFNSEFKYSVAAGHTDDAANPDGRLTVIANAPLANDVAAVRVVGFVNYQGGFITREFPNSAGALQSENNQGAQTDYGGSLSLLIKPSEAFSILPRVMFQGTEGHGLPAPYAPLPGFAVETFTMDRAADVQEYWNDKWFLPSLGLKYATQSWDLVSSTSYFHRNLNQIEDGTEGTIQQLGVPPYSAPASVFAGGVPWPQVQVNNNFYQELRAAWSGNSFMRAIFGGFYSDERQHWENGAPDFNFLGLVTTGTYPSPLLWDQPIDSSLTDKALYGELYFMAKGFELTLGGRQFWLNETFQVTNNGFVELGYSQSPLEKTSQSGFSPKVSLSYTVSQDALVYATAAKGFRAGGSNTPLSPACDPGLTQLGLTEAELAKYNSDNLWNYEVGAKGRVEGVALTGALFQMNWNQIQQGISVPVCFLPVLVNAGAARIRGAEFSADGRLAPDLQLHLGLGYLDAVITEAGLAPQLTVGSRVQAVPEFTGSVALTYTHPLSSKMDGFISTDYSYTGNMVDGTVTALFGQPPVTRAGYSLWNARIGTTWGPKQLFLYFRNITNSKANLGDVNPIAYARTQPDGFLDPRVAVQRPFQVGLQFSYGM